MDRSIMGQDSLAGIAITTREELLEQVLWLAPKYLVFSYIRVLTVLIFTRVAVFSRVGKYI